MSDKKTVLVIDDDREIVSAIRGTLEHAGYRVMTANNGVQGLQMTQQRRPDLIVTDMMMPKRGGFPVLESFVGKDDAPPVIMITANEGTRHKTYAEMLGVVDYLRKPFAMELLVESIQNAIGPGRSREEDKQPSSSA